MDSPAGAGMGYVMTAVAAVAAMTDATGAEGAEAVERVGREPSTSGILGEMAAPRTEKAGGKVGKVKAPKPKTFAEVGREAAKEAQRVLLLETCEAQGWNLTAVAEVLAMGAGANVIRALKNLAPEAYEKARDEGRISQANRREQ